MITEFTTTVESLWKGSFDLHVHANPDANREWRLDALELARQAREAGMGGLVLKSHQYPTAPLAYLVNKIVPEVRTFGSLTLNEEVGGLNPAAVDIAGQMEAKIIWMPTTSAQFHREQKKIGKPGLSIFDPRGKLWPVVLEIIELVKKYDMVLATGHLSAEEGLALIQEGRQRGAKMLFTHPRFFGFPLEAQKEAARAGAFVEYCFLDVMPTAKRTDPAEMAAIIKAVGVAHCLLTTDFGWPVNPPAPEGMRMLIGTMLGAGLSADEIETLVKKNPAQLLGLSKGPMTT